MANRKQRRRREKTFRHDYAFVTYDEEGNEVEVERPESREEKPQGEKRKQDASAKGQKQVRTGREPPEPSWGRAFRRGGTWGGVMLIVVIFFFQSTPLAGRILMGVFYAAAFIPLTYWIDRMAYRSWQKRQAKGAGR
jgi:hypothetical protein